MHNGGEYAKDPGAVMRVWAQKGGGECEYIGPRRLREILPGNGGQNGPTPGPELAVFPTERGRCGKTSDAERRGAARGPSPWVGGVDGKTSGQFKN